jgi:hypothetical protein
MDPWPRCAIRSLKIPDFVIALQCQRDLVEPLQEALAPSRIYLERDLLSGWRDNRLRLKVDADSSGALGDLDFGSKRVDDLLVDHDREDAILKAIGKEDVAKP